MEDQVATFIGSSLRLAMPLVLAASGELVSERSGVLNMSVEGMMLSAAFGAALGSWASGSPVIGLACGLAAVLPIALLQAWLSVTLRANQIVSGIGLNILVLGGTTLLYREIFGARSREEIPGFEKINIPGLSDIPVLGTALFQQVWLVYAGLALVLVVWWFLQHTATGLALRAAGEDPGAAAKAGINVRRVRYVGVLVAALMSALAGAFLSIGDIHTFTEGMTNGAGYLAIAAVIFGGWRVGRTLIACLLFGAATALQFQLPAMGVELPNAILIMSPYLLALLAMAGSVGRQTAPTALTLPYRHAH
jgi:general nucleoside transport system permease protein